MTLATNEFMRRFLLHVLPGGFHRIRHYGLLANGSRKTSLAASASVMPCPMPTPLQGSDSDVEIVPGKPRFIWCPYRGAAMLVLQTFTRGQSIRATTTAARTVSAIVCHVRTTRRLFSPKSQRGITSTCAAFLCSVAKDIAEQHAEIVAIRGTTPLPLIDAQRRPQSPAHARLPESP